MSSFHQYPSVQKAAQTRHHQKNNIKYQKASTSFVPILPENRPDANLRRQQQVILHLFQSGRRTNTSRAYGPKADEYRQYCDYRFPYETSETRYTLTADKFYDYLWYQAMRELRPRTGGRRKTDILQKVVHDNCPHNNFNANHNDVYDKNVEDMEIDPNDIVVTFENYTINKNIFDYAEYENLIMKYRVSNLSEVPTPINPMSITTWNQYRSSLRNIWETQVANRINNIPYEFLCTEPVKKLAQYVKDRKPITDRMLYKEKLGHEFAPFTAIEQLKCIEKRIWDRASGNSWRSGFAWIKYRFIFLFSFGGILRGESLFKAELSDLVSLRLKKPTDIHPLELFVLQIATGKTNHTVQLYGRIMRHFDPTLCGYSAFGFYLLYRYEITGEMESPPDFRNNNDWFDDKLLIDYPSKNYKDEIKNNGYSTAIRTVLTELNIPSAHFVHIGRVLAPAFLEYNEVETNEIKNLGNWEPGVVETRYSTKLPMRPIRIMAGFSDSQIHYNLRTIVEPPIELQKLIFPWADASLEDVQQHMQQNSVYRYTASAFLKLCINLRRVILQDAAVILIQNPERHTHPMFNLRVFKSKAFTEFVQVMKEHIDTDINPTLSTIDQHIPGLNQRLTTLQNSIELTRNTVDNKYEKLNHNLINAVTQSNSNTRMELSKKFAEMAMLLARPGTSANRTDNLSIPVIPVQPVLQGDPDTDSHVECTDKSTLEDDFQQYCNCRMDTPVLSLHVAYDQYFGTGDYVGIPVEGGFHALEAKYSFKYRAHWTGAEKSYFNRIQRVLLAVRNTASNSSVTEQHVLSEYQDIFSSLGCALFPLVKKLQERGDLQFSGTRKRRSDTA